MAPPTTRPTTLAKRWAAQGTQGTQGRGRGHPCPRGASQAGQQGQPAPSLLPSTHVGSIQSQVCGLVLESPRRRAARPSLRSVDAQRAVRGRGRVGTPSGQKPLLLTRQVSCSLRVGAGRGNGELRDRRGCRGKVGSSHSAPPREHSRVPSRIQWTHLCREFTGLTVRSRRFPTLLCTRTHTLLHISCTRAHTHTRHISGFISRAPPSPAQVQGLLPPAHHVT